MAVPFYGESSFLMYRKDVFQQKGITMPERPTWAQVADAAAKVDGAQPGMKGICLRGLPGWGEMFAPLTTVVNTFGGTWFTKDWQAQVNSPEFTKAVDFYVNLIKQHGEAGAAQAGFTECLNAMSQSKVAMWYDATSAAGTLEDPSASNVAGKIGYAYAPVDKTESSGWLWTWAWTMPKTTKKADSAAKFALWASSKEYEELVGKSSAGRACRAASASRRTRTPST
jgi:sorbitol/mannitol transport system substrate-binding protein